VNLLKISFKNYITASIQRKGESSEPGDGVSGWLVIRGIYCHNLPSYPFVLLGVSCGKPLPTTGLKAERRKLPLKIKPSENKPYIYKIEGNPKKRFALQFFVYNC